MPAVAVTVAVLVVVSFVAAFPPASVLTTPALNEPAVVLNVTGRFGNAFPLMSRIVAVIVLSPPAAGTVEGLALMAIFDTAAAPTAILTALAAATLAPPDEAVIVAVPDAVPALNVTTARPVLSVVALAG